MFSRRRHIAITAAEWRYKTKPSLIGAAIEIAYDSEAPEIITVSHAGTKPFTAKPLKIGSYCDPNLAIPAVMQIVTPKT